MKKCFKHNDFLHEHFTTAILLQLSMSHVVELLSKLNSTDERGNAQL